MCSWNAAIQLSEVTVSRRHFATLPIHVAPSLCARLQTAVCLGPPEGATTHHRLSYNPTDWELRMFPDPGPVTCVLNFDLFALGPGPRQRHPPAPSRQRPKAPPQPPARMCPKGNPPKATLLAAAQRGAAQNGSQPKATTKEPLKGEPLVGRPPEPLSLH